MSEFNPYQHIESIKGKPYLPTQYRIAWFRAVHPTGAIITNPVEISGVLMIRAEIYSGDNTLLASGMATIRDQAGQTWTGRVIEKAETAAIARALAHAGFEITDTAKTVSNATQRAASGTHDRQSPPATKTPQTPVGGANSGKFNWKQAAWWKQAVDMLFVEFEIEREHGANLLNKWAKEGRLLQDMTEEQALGTARQIASYIVIS
jgi:hypothetical protein